jgi:DNA-binding NarL/FixJ family response regulator
MIRILLVDDQDLLRQGLASLLALEEDLLIVGQANNGNVAIEQATELQPDVILMDVRMPVCDGVTATKEIHQRFPWMRILVLTTFDDDEYIWQSLQAGALGYLLKSTPSNQLANAIRTLYQGHSQLGPGIASRVLAQLNAPSPEPTPESPTPESPMSDHHFSDREREILQLLGQGLNNKEIAQQLFLTEGTVKNHISRILAELGMRDRTQAALWAQRYLG